MSHNYEFSNDWFEAQRPFHEKFLSGQENRELHIIEIGTHEAQSTVFFIDQFLHHHASTITSIDPYWIGDTTSPVTSSTESVARRNIDRSTYPDKWKLLKESSSEALAKLILQGDRFNYALVDGSHLAHHVLLDALLCRHLLSVNGILFFDDYLGGDEHRDSDARMPKQGIDRFLDLCGPDFHVLHRGYHLVLQLRERVSS